MIKNNGENPNGSSSALRGKVAARRRSGSCLSLSRHHTPVSPRGNYISLRWAGRLQRYRFWIITKRLAMKTSRFILLGPSLFCPHHPSIRNAGYDFVRKDDVSGFRRFPGPYEEKRFSRKSAMISLTTYQLQLLIL